MKKQSNLSSLIRSLRPYLIKIIFAIILSVASAVITVVSPQIVEDLCNEIAFTSSVNLKNVAKYGFILVGMYVFGFLTQYISNVIMIVVTIKEINGLNRISEFIKKCELKGWFLNQFSVENRIDINLKAEEELEFE